jgi:hypothetical protein
LQAYTDLTMESIGGVPVLVLRRASVIAGAGVDDRVDRLVHVVRDHP